MESDDEGRGFTTRMAAPNSSSGLMFMDQLAGTNQVLIKNQYISVEGGDLIADWGEIHMIKDLPPPAEAEECRNTAEIVRDLAAHVRVWQHTQRTRQLAENLDRLAAHAERQISRAPV
jgi:hypothetical protein